MLASYATSFGNDSDSFSRIMGKKATLVNIGGEGSPRWKLVEEKGNHEDNPTIARAERWMTLPVTTSPARSTSATKTSPTSRTGSSASAAGTPRQTRPSTTVSCIQSRSSWPRSVLAGQAPLLRRGVGTDQGQRTSVLVRRGPWLTRTSLNTTLTAPARNMRLRRWGYPQTTPTGVSVVCPTP